MPQINTLEQLLKATALVAAAIAVLILAWYLVRRPPLNRTTKVLLLFGLGVMPIGVALTGNIAGFEYTLKRPFCGSCHVMLPYTEDAADPASTSLAAIHSRNHAFGEESCYTCHADYQMFGAMTTKLNGLKHLYFYVTEYANTGPYGEGGPKIHMYKAFQNGMCTRCHSTTAPRWLANEEHSGMIEEIRSGDAKCVDCHGGEKVHPRAFAHGGNGRGPAASTGKGE
ncbi:NapC/NirT family cytochrome c [Anaeromyxobacter sp. PSR-1]|uniref:NapC/NirT family cytochrome c n=1 Tax=unclassified Anaeromyxobacter TaxID=2620896 RepID=UPI0005E76853|nr:NapC/NirT family cytochrome c [Anaeromyxobacter sp. PSR-1]GAO04319.1 cytochrome c-type protein TorC [Anaeromyxobacter sp. PSR-1]